ncbi:hypothetical protein CLD22_26220, partial [Rubrivivax gelatinosus]|nr:hypothetical protein [Rubrivivax gelatinosus]
MDESCVAACNAVVELQQADDEAVALDVLQRVAGHLHADSACFVTSVLELPPDRSSLRMLAACDLAWASDYVRLRRCGCDPWLRFARRSIEPVLASQLFVEGNEVEAVRTAAEAGMRSVWIVPAPSPFGGHWASALYLASSTAGYFEGQPALARQVKLLAWVLTLQLQQWMRTRLQTELLASSGLTGGDIELLRHEDRRHGSK